MKTILLSKWTKAVVFVASLVPLANLVWRGFHNDLTANPIEFITHTTGDWTLLLLIMTLAISPLRKILHQPLLIRYRRMLGLFAFFYVCLHFSTWIGLDKFFNWSEMWKDVQKRRFITVGFSGFVLLDPAGDHFHRRLDPPPWRQALAALAPPDLRHGHTGRDSLFLAGKIRHHQAFGIRLRSRYSALLARLGMAAQP